MKQRLARRLVVLTCLALGTFTLGGCPVGVDDPAQRLSDATESGQYWVEERDGGLYYFELPLQRQSAGRWTALEEESDWFSGPAFYSFSNDEGWTRAADADGLTLDDALQVHDPAPAVPN